MSAQWQHSFQECIYSIVWKYKLADRWKNEHQYCDALLVYENKLSMDQGLKDNSKKYRLASGRTAQACLYNT